MRTRRVGHRGVRIAAKGGANAAAKIVELVAGMVVGADSISDMDLLRHVTQPRDTPGCPIEHDLLALTSDMLRAGRSTLR
jgi:hypothetical protein